ncbi:hypothetical protein [Asaia astilbis]
MRYSRNQYIDVGILAHLINVKGTRAPVQKLYRLGHVDEVSDPDLCGGDIEEAHRRQSDLVAEGRDAAHLHDAVEHPLDAIAIPVTLLACFLRSAAILS